MILLAPLAFAAAPSESEATALSGDWRLAEPRDVVEARIDAAVEGLLAPLNVVVRTVARPRIRAAAKVCDAYHTTVTTTSFTVTCDGRTAADVPFGQPPRAGTSPDGRAYAVTAAWTDGAVLLTFTGDEGGQTVRYQVVDGSLVVEKSLFVERLDARMSWPMRYAHP